MEHRAHLVGRKIDVDFAVVARHITVAIAMPLNHAFDFIEKADSTVGSGEVADVFNVKILGS